MPKPEVIKRAELKGHAGPVYALCGGASPDTIFSGSSDGFVAEWNLKTLQAERFSVKIGKPVYSLCHLKEYSLLVIGLGSGEFHVIDLTEKKEIRLIAQHSSAIFDCAWNPVKKQLYTVSSDGYMCVWEIPSFRLLLTYPVCSDKIRNVAVSPSGDRIALACGDGLVREYETEFFNLLRECHAHTMSVNSVHYLNEERLLSGGKDAFLHHWNNKESFPVLSVPAHNYAIYSIVTDPHGNYFATGSRDKTIKLWDRANGAFLLRIDRKEFAGHRHSVNRLLWHVPSGLLISTGDDRSIFVWEIN